MRIPGREREIFEVGFQTIPLEIVRSREVPALHQIEGIGRGEVYLFLFVFVINGYQPIVVIEVVRVIGCVFGVEFGLIAVGHLHCKSALQEGVDVPKSFAVAPDVVDDSARDTALGVVIVSVQFPRAFFVAQLSIETRFQAGCVYVSVLTDCCGVVGNFAQHVQTPVSEFILACGVGPLSAERSAQIVVDLFFENHGRIDQPERSGAECRP